jgi:hypothetical protein
LLLGQCLGHARGGQAQVGVVGQGAVDEGVELRIAHGVPPGAVNGGGCFGAGGLGRRRRAQRVVAPLRGHVEPGRFGRGWQRGGAGAQQCGRQYACTTVDPETVVG